MPASWLLGLFVITVAVLYALAVWQRAWIYRAHEFLGEVKVELKKVTWPGRREVLATTSVVIVTVFFFGVFLSLVDFVVTLARTQVFSVVERFGRG